MGCGLSGAMQQAATTGLAGRSGGKPSNSKYNLGNLGDLTKHRHLSAHFGLKYQSNDGINRDRFCCKNFPNIHTFKPAKKNPG